MNEKICKLKSKKIRNGNMEENGSQLNSENFGKYGRN